MNIHMTLLTFEEPGKEMTQTQEVMGLSHHCGG